MSTQRAIPPSPRWQSAAAPAGCKFYALATAGSVVRDLSPAGRRGTNAGATTRPVGPYGRQVGGFTATAGVEFNTADAQVMGNNFPNWMAALVVVPSGVGGVPVSQGFSGQDTNYAFLNTVTGTGTVLYESKGGAAGAFALSAAGTAIADGRPHVLMGVSRSLTSHFLHVDGVQVATTSAAIEAFLGVGTPRVSIGYLGTTGNYGPFSGSVIWFGMGNGAVPDALALAADLLSGTFAAVRPRSSTALMASHGAPSFRPFASPIFASSIFRGTS